ncbi:hypothetical protein DdX_20593 [Ditylenchus destructor]|uniref:Uncharacterized protein n=1 Tax=Ditylenchus destructor TaxID=166010 RepID=A0AAD4QRS4_9BILA|nr:hypothetical protein DdX_20593 [Ditylenchus destructor]
MNRRFSTSTTPLRAAPTRSAASPSAMARSTCWSAPTWPRTTIYRSRAPNGFYGQLAKGKTFTWLDPVKLPERRPTGCGGSATANSFYSPKLRLIPSITNGSPGPRAARRAGG